MDDSEPDPEDVAPLLLLLNQATKPSAPRPLKKPDQRSSNTRSDPRCRRCGRLKQSDPVAKGKHANRKRKTTAAFCRVDPSDYLPGYPKGGYESIERERPTRQRPPLRSIYSRPPTLSFRSIEPLPSPTIMDYHHETTTTTNQDDNTEDDDDDDDFVIVEEEENNRI